MGDPLVEELRKGNDLVGVRLHPVLPGGDVVHELGEPALGLLDAYARELARVLVRLRHLAVRSYVVRSQLEVPR